MIKLFSGYEIGVSEVILVIIQVSIVFVEHGIGTKYLKANFALLRLCCGHIMTVVRIQNGC